MRHLYRHVHTPHFYEEKLRFRGLKTELFLVLASLQRFFLFIMVPFAKIIGCYAGLLILVTSFQMRMVQSCLRRLIRSVVSCASVSLISELA
jgi:hypothetical protein